MKDLEQELKTLQFKYDLLKKIQKETSNQIKKELALKEKELQIWKDYAYKVKPREDKMMQMVKRYTKLNEELEEKIAKYKENL
jgi:hypothetical protein|tara:strand:- start:652 stop:900 length:249 start_codon:yes stop_codon:yes gene_type:complete